MKRYFNKSNQSTLLGIMCYLSFVFLTIVSTIITKLANIKFSVNVIQFLFYRTIVCCILLLPFAIKENMLFLKKENFHQIFAVGLHMFSIYIWYYAIQHAPLNTVSIAAFIVPIFVNILSIIFLKEKISRHLWLSMLFCLLAVALINQDKMQFTTINNNLISISYIPTFIFIFVRSIAIILEKKALTKASPLRMLFYSCFTGLFIGPMVMQILPFQLINMTFDAWIYEAFNVIAYLLQMWLMYKAFSLCKISTLQPIEFTKFIFSAILSHLFLNEYLTIYQFFAVIIIFASNVILIKKSI